MRKIDRETRTRFQDTFDRVNAGLKEKFPRLFGGGHAYLELRARTRGCRRVGDGASAGQAQQHDQPAVGRREGADRGRAGVRDLRSEPGAVLPARRGRRAARRANVGRFCDIVRDMSRSVQFIFITHNKSTMEMASQLIGVTMNEPGVSRLVAVDVDEAVRMAAM
jgi:chromosome segregation protein